MPPFPRDSILTQLDRLLSSGVFQGASRSKTLLKFLVDQTIDGHADRLKEYTLGAEALGKGESFDPRTDPSVRAEASRLRTRLERYYATEGQADTLVIALPKGSYVPDFQTRGASIQVAAAPTPEHVPSLASPTGRLPWLAWIGVAAISALAGALWTARRAPRPAEPSLVQFDVELKSDGTLGSEVGTDVVLSPDGTRVVFVSRGSDGAARLNTRRLDQPGVTALPGTEGARGPFFAPDGRWIGFWAAGKLKKMPTEGGSPVVLCDATDLLGGSWGDDGHIVAALSAGKLWRVSSSGGAPTVVVDLGKESAAPLWPQVLPGGRRVLFTAVGPLGPNAASIEALSFPDGKRTVLARGGTFGRYLPNGHLTYVNQGTLFAVPFDLDRLQPRGNAIPILDDVAYSASFGFAQLDFSQTGTLAYRKNIGGGQLVVEWLDAAGSAGSLLAKPGRYLWPSLSPEGRRLAVSVTESGAASVFVYEHALDRTTRLIAPGQHGAPLWGPDGRVLVLGGASGLFWTGADGAGQPEPLTSSRTIQVPWSFSPDGKLLAYHAMGSSTAFDLWTVPVHSVGRGLAAGQPVPFLQTPSFEVFPSFSPDGRWLAYGSNESGTWEVYVRAFPDDGTKVRVSDAGGRIPRWSPNGRELFYRTDDQHLMVAPYATRAGSFVAYKPRRWSRTRLADTGVLPNFDLAPDGRRVVALVAAARPDDQPTENHATFILHFFDEVRRRVSPGGR